eukprot:c20209_g1_i2.p1 GENE.c20209_g1_i2~~c20209_g1_i2.p1  ORF type:complete len:610 (+),score=103.69 c20209_g1_i2:194-2023(+)
MQLRGSIPIGVGKLTSLTLWDVSNNRLSGSIPSEVGKLTSLASWNLGTNQLSGTIPTEVGKLTSLTEWRLDKNELIGSIPTEVGKLTSLTEWRLDKNELIGSIPTEVGKLTKLNFWNLGTNKLIASIPTEVGKLTNLNFWAMFSNRLGGAIPSEVGKFTGLIEWNLDDNQLMGSIPSEVGTMTSLTGWSCFSNRLSGSIPTEVGMLTSLTYWDIENNQFSGFIPSEVGRLTNLSSWNVHNNQLSGSIPTEVGELTSLTHWVLHQTFVTASSLPFCTVTTCTSTLIAPEVCPGCTLAFPVLTQLSAIVQGVAIANSVQTHVNVGDTIVLTFPPMPYVVRSASIARQSVTAVTDAWNQLTYRLVVTETTVAGPVSISVRLFHNSTGEKVQSVVTSGSLIVDIVSTTPSSSNSHAASAVPYATAGGAVVSAIVIGLIILWFRRRRNLDYIRTDKLVAVIQDQSTPHTVLSALAKVPFLGPKVDDSAPRISFPSGSQVVPMRKIRNPQPQQHIRIHCWEALVEIHRPMVQALIDMDAELNGYDVEKALAIRLYTIGEPKIHAELTRVFSPSESTTLQKWIPFVKLLSQALDDLSAEFRFSGTCYRGVKEVFPN